MKCMKRRDWIGERICEHQLEEVQRLYTAIERAKMQESRGGRAMRGLRRTVGFLCYRSGERLKTNEKCNKWDYVAKVILISKHGTENHQEHSSVWTKLLDDLVGYFWIWLGRENTKQRWYTSDLCWRDFWSVDQISEWNGKPKRRVVYWDYIEDDSLSPVGQLECNAKTQTFNATAK